MANDFVTVKGKKYYVKDDRLNLKSVGITQITEIKGLEKFTNLQELWLDNTQIAEIKGLETLTNLQRLGLNSNQIGEIKGLETLTNLQELYLPSNQIVEIKGLKKLTSLQTLWLDNNQITELKGLETLTSLLILGRKGNPIRADEKYLLDKSPQEIVQYCQEKAGKITKEVHVERPAPPPPTEASLETIIPPKSQPIKALTIKRGYETAGQYIKVGIKVENASPTTITGVKVILEPPSGLELVNPTSEVITLGVLLPNGAQGANFQLRPIRCVDEVIHATIIYRDATGNSVTEDIEALNVRNICPMLTDEGVDEAHILMSLRKGDIRKNRSSFKFRGALKTAFAVAVSRVRGLIPLDSDERFINDHYIANACYIGRTKYGKFDFATEISVCGKENEGRLTIAVYSEEEAILSGFFYEVLEDVKKSVEIVEERVKVVDEACPECGGTFAKEQADAEGYIRCDLCATLLRLPSWERGTKS